MKQRFLHIFILLLLLGSFIGALAFRQHKLRRVCAPNHIVSRSTIIAVGEISKNKRQLFTLQNACQSTITERSQSKAAIILADGTTLNGYSIGAIKSVEGELVFSTSMVGYAEALTDPSYKNQIIIFSYPMIGNYGVPSLDMKDKFGLSAGFESNKINVAAVIVQDYHQSYSHAQASLSLSSWLKKENIPGIYGIDTRLLIKKIRSLGSINAKITFDTQPVLPSPIINSPLISSVSTENVQYYGKGNTVKITVLDCGVKFSIIRALVSRGAEVKLVPWNHNLVSELSQSDGFVISNGPGDPSQCVSVVKGLSVLMQQMSEQNIIKPIFGICLGHQLLALASGAITKKLLFGNRGHNQPVQNLFTGDCHITAQNHGYAVDEASLFGTDWAPLYKNIHDHTNEGMIHKYLPFFSTQFHPEANGGPMDTMFLFDVYLQAVKEKRKNIIGLFPHNQYLDHSYRTSTNTSGKNMRKVLVLGSGGLSIGQAGEFDYSGAQAIKALKEENIQVIVVNPNIASVQTNLQPVSPQPTDTANQRSIYADTVYSLPITPQFVEAIIAKERPDGILISVGGQTALNCGVALYHQGVLLKYAVQVLGTSVATIMTTEDRELFRKKMISIQEPLTTSQTVTSVVGALQAARDIGYPVMIRSGYTLGGLGSGLCADADALQEKVQLALQVSPQVIVEQSLAGWKEIEYEVVRDVADHCVTVCNMENLDPVGMHTGDSIVVAPSQTLSNTEYHVLRAVAIKVVRALEVVGECNIQFAIRPKATSSSSNPAESDLEFEYRIIEVNARLSRSSALASKATGYPLAFVATKLSLGYTLPEIANQMTGGNTTAFFEPSLDYVVTKVPRWAFEKFPLASRRLNSAMKSVGEVMAIGRTWEESIQKALRMVSDDETSYYSSNYVKSDASSIDFSAKKKYLLESIKEELQHPTPQRIFAILIALQQQLLTVTEVATITNIDPWFLHRLERITSFRRQLSDLLLPKRSTNASDKENPLLNRDLLLQAKQLGFSDTQIAFILNNRNNNDDNNNNSVTAITEDMVRSWRLHWQIKPWVKQIDTVAAEYPAHTQYCYLTYHGSESDTSDISNDDINYHNRRKNIDRSENDYDNSILKEQEKESIIVLGAGGYRIGSSVEFDWAAVSTLRSLKEHQDENHICPTHENCITGTFSSHKDKKKDRLSIVMINCNPETVSADYDECSRLYFEELSHESVLDIYAQEKASGVIVSVGGQVPHTLAKKWQYDNIQAGNNISKQQITILGTSADNINSAEDRDRFSSLLDALHIQQPPWKKVQSLSEALTFAAAPTIGYPVVLRPSYVLSGANMRVITNPQMLVDYFRDYGSSLSQERKDIVDDDFYSIDKDSNGDKLFASTSSSLSSLSSSLVISKFIQQGEEIDVDGIACGGEVLLAAISQHVEEAGIHSGDASLILSSHQPYLLNSSVSSSSNMTIFSPFTAHITHDIARTVASIVRALNVTGPFNLQCILTYSEHSTHNNSRSNDDCNDNDNHNENNTDFQIWVIECNVRASRSLPLVSKTIGGELHTNWMDLAARLSLSQHYLNNHNNNDNGHNNNREFGQSLYRSVVRDIELLRDAQGTPDTMSNNCNDTNSDGNTADSNSDDNSDANNFENHKKKKSVVTAVKMPVFSFHRLPGADPVLGIDMRATGEIAVLSRQSVTHAFLQAVIATHPSFCLPYTKNNTKSNTNNTNNSDGNAMKFSDTKSNNILVDKNNEKGHCKSQKRWNTNNISDSKNTDEGLLDENAAVLRKHNVIVSIDDWMIMGINNSTHSQSNSAVCTFLLCLKKLQEIGYHLYIPVFEYDIDKTNTVLQLLQETEVLLADKMTVVNAYKTFADDNHHALFHMLEVRNVDFVIQLSGLSSSPSSPTDNLDNTNVVRSDTSFANLWQYQLRTKSVVAGTLLCTNLRWVQLLVTSLREYVVGDLDLYEVESLQEILGNSTKI